MNTTLPLWEIQVWRRGGGQGPVDPLSTMEIAGLIKNEGVE
jgi:hypothetical protein